MSRQPATTDTLPPAVAVTEPTTIGRARTAIVALALAVGALGSALVTVWQPWQERDQFGYAVLAPVRDGVWAGAIIEALATAVMGFALGVAVCRLVPRRGAVWATVGAVLTGLGGAAFCAGMAGFGILTWYATATGGLSAEAGTGLMAYVEQDRGHVAALQAGGFLALTLGTLLLMVALWRSRSVPRWVPVAYLVLTVGIFAGLGGGRVLDVVQAVQVLTSGSVAWFLWRAASRPTAG
jgi:hypothetical protein